MILQPKRWQKADDPRYDPIRHKPWFSRLLKRKQIIPLMEAALSYMQVHESDITQAQLCEFWAIDPRDFRDFRAFWQGESFGTSKTFQAILDGAYHLYQEHNAIRPIQRFIDDVAPLYGVNYRHVWEMWEVDPAFYPSDYKYPKN